MNESAVSNERAALDKIKKYLKKIESKVNNNYLSSSSYSSLSAQLEMCREIKKIIGEYEDA